MTSPFGAASRRNHDDSPRFRHPMDPPPRFRKRLALLAAFGAVLVSGGGLAMIAAPHAVLAPASNPQETALAAAPLVAASNKPEMAKTVRQASVVGDTRTAAKTARPVKAELLPEDPRWAVEMEGEGALASTNSELNPAIDGPAPDAEVTAAIAPRNSPLAKPSRKIAEKPAAPVRYTIGEAWTGFATEHVKLRAGPDNGSAVLSVVPSSAAVTVHGCKGWCNVSYRGQRGFVFKSFLRTADAVQPAAVKKPAAAKPLDAKPKKEKAAEKPLLSIWDTPR